MPNILSKQVGPFPLGGWLAIGGAGVGIAVLATRGKGGSRKPGLYQSGESVQPVTFDQSAPGLVGGDTEPPGPTFLDLLEAYRLGLDDGNPGVGEPDPTDPATPAPAMPGTNPPSWQQPVTPPRQGNTPPAQPVPVPPRTPPRKVVSRRTPSPARPAPQPASQPAPTRRGVLTPSPNAPRPQLTWQPDGTFSLYPNRPSVPPRAVPARGVPARGVLTPSPNAPRPQLTREADGTFSLYSSRKS